MKDRNIETIAYLSQFLYQVQTDKEDVERERDHAGDELQTLRHRCQTLEEDLLNVRAQCQSLTTTADWKIKCRANTFATVLRYPNAFVRAIDFMRSDDFRPTEKIAMIKKVREVGGFGLKEAKDLVEGYIELGLHTSQVEDF